MKLTKEYNWGLNDEMNSLLNDIDLNSERRVILTSGKKQFVYDNGEVYSTSPTNYSKEVKISKAEFKEQAEEIMLNYKCNKKNNIIIE